ncbi:MAG TPA: DUF4954 family protein [Bacteroidales bacterium]|nr:DUF4954 family protein [Bacteroidales bacterium]
MQNRELTDGEITTLRQQGCRADDWTNIRVTGDFSVKNIHHVIFGGKVNLGSNTGEITLEKGLTRHCGLYNSFIRDCTVGNGVYISSVSNLCNYVVEDDTAIEDSGTILVNAATTFGNGIEIAVLNESEGRELMITDRLSAQLAYMLVLYRHDKDLITSLKAMIMSYAAEKKSVTGTIGNGARIRQVQTIRNVDIGPYAVISGAVLLEEGTIKSNREAPSVIGEGVIATRFILLSGSSLTGGAYLENCFVGQGVRIGRQFSAENSAFFANCEGTLGEACSLFAGPYTVSHHKSTLLIAGMFSFYNAGSGSNQSNHMYKLGPLHQGVLERGSKTGSSSYLLWPCRIGPFSVVVGKHYTNFDTGDFPFSYITEEKGKSILYPAMNLFTVGTRRDSGKWPARDRRKDTDKLDIINFSLFNPYVAGKMVNAVMLLGDMAEKSNKSQDQISYNGINIPRLLLKTTRKFYENALSVYTGGELVRRLESLAGDTSLQQIRDSLLPGDNPGEGKWIDLFGMLSPEEEIRNLTGDVKSGIIHTIGEFQDRLQAIHDKFDNYAWNWCASYIRSATGTAMADLTREQLLALINDWKESSIRLNNMILKDAEKDFDNNSMIGYGADGDEKTRIMDFEAVRGTYGENGFVIQLKKETADIENTARKLLTKLQNIT